MTGDALKYSIMAEEAEFPRAFAECEERGYGLLFHMDDNRDSYDGNHAFIYPERVDDLGLALRDIRAFYEKRNIRPSIYHPHKSGYFAQNADTLSRHGFRYCPSDDYRVMLRTAENALPRRADIETRVLDGWDERIAEDILIPGGEPWEIEVTKRSARNGGVIIAAFENGRARSYMHMHASCRGNTRFDYIVTAPSARGRGFGGALINRALEYAEQNSLPPCWMWAGGSESLCKRAGFREAFTIPAGWAACSFDAKLV